MPIKSDREYRRIDVTGLEVREEQDGKKIVEGYATTFGNEYRLWGDAYYEVWESIDAHAFRQPDIFQIFHLCYCPRYSEALCSHTCKYVGFGIVGDCHKCIIFPDGLFQKHVGIPSVTIHYHYI